MAVRQSAEQIVPVPLLGRFESASHQLGAEMTIQAGDTKLLTKPSFAERSLRAFLVAVGLGLWFFTQSLIGARPLSPLDNEGGAALSRNDAIFRLTQSVNDYLHENSRAADALLVISSAVIDVLGIWLIVWSVLGRSIRPFLGLILLFALRQLMQTLCVLPTPEGMIWRSPGVPTLLVTYDVANDFFFSGHTAIAVFAATQLARLKRPALLALAFAVALGEAATVLVVRCHYTIDVFTGAIAALWVAELADRLGPRCDRGVRRLVGVRGGTEGGGMK
jgi:hypothetical protein